MGWLAAAAKPPPGHLLTAEARDVMSQGKGHLVS